MTNDQNTVTLSPVPMAADDMDERQRGPAAPDPHRQSSSRRVEHMDDTRNGLIQAARELFTVQGYDATSIDEIVRRARVTKGALSTFSSKEEVFKVVLDMVETEFIGAPGEVGAPGDNVWEQVQNGCQAFLDVVARSPDVQRIVLLDGQSAMGWEAWRELEMKYGFGRLEGFLDQATTSDRTEAAAIAMREGLA